MPRDAVDHGKCHCGHAMRSHHSYYYGQRNYTNCKFCECLIYVPKSSKKSEWERLNKIKVELKTSLMPHNTKKEGT